MITDDATERRHRTYVAASVVRWMKIEPISTVTRRRGKRNGRSDELPAGFRLRSDRAVQADCTNLSSDQMSASQPKAQATEVI